ncbi:hypothetical protein NL354_30005, partial [Klebsiella pneumoniae]|nr:hypothetical protein [Klebsiella pneumoniae]
WVDIEKALRQLRRVAIELRLAGYEAQSENVQQAILPFANLDPDSFKWSELETASRAVKFGTMKSVQKKEEHHVYHTV